jgi:hypothetical protein
MEKHITILLRKALEYPDGASIVLAHFHRTFEEAPDVIEFVTWYEGRDGVLLSGNYFPETFTGLQEAMGDFQQRKA